MSNFFLKSIVIGEKYHSATVLLGILNLFHVTFCVCRKNKCYSELPFTDPRGQGHVPMFMPKNMNGLQPTSSANNPNAIQMVNNPNPHMHRQLQHQQGLDSNTMFMLNQSKISDGSDQSQTRIASRFFSVTPFVWRFVTMHNRCALSCFWAKRFSFYHEKIKNAVFFGIKLTR